MDRPHAPRPDIPLRPGIRHRLRTVRTHQIRRGHIAALVEQAIGEPSTVEACREIGRRVRFHQLEDQPIAIRNCLPGNAAFNGYHLDRLVTLELHRGLVAISAADLVHPIGVE